MPSSWYKEFMAGHGVNVGSRKPSPTRYTGPPMDLANMRMNKVRSILVSCLDCTHSQVVNVDSYDDGLPVKWFQGRMLCKCGSKNTDVRPNWSEAPKWKPTGR